MPKRGRPVATVGQGLGDEEGDSLVDVLNYLDERVATY